MLTGSGYVVAAYGIWVGAFAIYILLTKRRLKITNESVITLQERSSKTADKLEIEE